MRRTRLSERSPLHFAKYFPDETYLLIFQFLDFNHVLCTLSRCCSRFTALSCNPLCFRAIDLSGFMRRADHQFFQRVISCCGKIQSLDLTGCRKIPSESFRLLAECPCLVTVDFSETLLADQDLTSLVQCAQLQAIRLHDCAALTWVGLRSLAALPTLQSLHLGIVHQWHAQHTDEALREVLHKCPHLTELTLCYPRSLGFLHVDTALSLRRLVLECSETIDVSTLSDLPGHHYPHLQTLSWTGTKSLPIDNVLLSIASKCQALQSLDLSRTSISDAALATLAITLSQSLRTLNLSSCQHFTGAGLVQVCSQLPLLHTLVLNRCEQVTSDELIQMSEPVACPLLQLLELEQTSLAHCHFDDQSMSLFVACHPALTSLNLASTQCGDLTLRELGRSCPALERLNLARCVRVTDLGLKYLGQTASALRYLNLTKCRAITNAGVRSLAQGCPLLKRDHVVLLRCARIVEGDMLLPE